MVDDEDFDVIIVGAGPVGIEVAERAARGGLSAVVIERRLVGGECNYYGCVPSKALLWPVEIAAAVNRMPGIKLAGPIDPAAVEARRDAIVTNYQDAENVALVENLPATVIHGQGRLTGPNHVEVTTPDGTHRSLAARHAVVLATGSDPAIPEIPGLAAASPWTNREATSVTRAPRRLVVLGGGPVGCEMSQALLALGSEQVTIVEPAGRLLPRLEAFVSEILVHAFEVSGIVLRFGRSVVGIERPVAGGVVSVNLDDGSSLEADELLVAAGRVANVPDIGLESVGLEASGPLSVDAQMRVKGISGDWLYAVGDLNGRYLLTHMGKYQARVCGDVIVSRASGVPGDESALRDVADDFGAPQAIFTDPEVIAVGRTESEARAEGFDVRTVEYDIGKVPGAALQADGYAGRAKIVVDSDRSVLLGATFVGPGVVDHLHAATIAVSAEVPLDRLWHAVPAFPTTSEIWLALLKAYGL